MQVVLSLEEKYNEKLRKLANELYNGRKGGMSAVVKTGIDLVEEKTKCEGARAKLLFMAENAKDLGIGKFDREEAHAR